MRLKTSVTSIVLALLLIATLLPGITPGQDSEFHQVRTAGGVPMGDRQNSVGHPGKIAFDQDGQIFLINADGTNLHQVTFSAPGVYNYQPALSPDGTRIAFSAAENGKSGITVINSDGSAEYKLTNNEMSYDSEAAWSPDGSQIAFVRGFDATFGGIANQTSCGSEIYTIWADRPSAGVSSITQGSGGTDPSWSPDGSQIAYASNRTGNYEVFVYSFDGAKTDRLTHSSEHEAEPAWSPDGQQIAYARGYLHANFDCGFAHTGLGNVPVTNGPDIWVMSNDGHNQSQLTETANNREPSWSPDGKALCFISYREGATQLFVVDQFQKSEYSITFHGGEKSSPSWSN
jgi:TolB protein